jgi:cytochrome c-type biogenesis protein CcsB
MDILLLKAAFSFYITAMILYVAYAATKREPLATFGRLALIAGLAFHAANLAQHMFADPERYGPWTHWAGSMSFFAFVIVAEYLIIQGRNHLPVLGAFVTPVIVAVSSAALSVSNETRPTLPLELQSNWMAVHVPVIFLAYGSFAIAFTVGLAYLIQERQIKSKKPSHLAFRLPSLDELDALLSRVITVGWAALLLGLALGSLWAERAWGRYWGWDAKETSALVTLLVYTVYFYVRIITGWRGRRTVLVSLIGFAMVWFTYAGVNYFSNLHGFLAGRS